MKIDFYKIFAWLMVLVYLIAAWAFILKTIIK